MVKKKRRPMKDGRVKTLTAVMFGVYLVTFAYGVYRIIDPEYPSVHANLIVIEAGIALAVTLLPVYLEKIFEVKMSLAITALMHVFLVMAVIMGETIQLYHITKWYDKLLHALSGVLIAAAAYGMAAATLRGRGFKHATAVCLVLSVAASIAVAALWEAAEYTIDNILGTNLQKFIPENPYDANDPRNHMYNGGAGSKPLNGTDEELVEYFREPDGYRYALVDTMQDIIWCVTGTATFALFCAGAGKKRAVLETAFVKIHDDAAPYPTSERKLSETLVGFYDADKTAALNPSDLRAPIANFPATCVGILSETLVKNLVAKLSPETIANAGGAASDYAVYAAEINGRRIGFYTASPGAPAAVEQMETVAALGAKNFLFVGRYDRLGNGVKDGSFVIPVRALRDEGTSYRYLPPADAADLKPAAYRAVERTFKREKLPYVKGVTWTTDGPFRKTEARVARVTEMGAKVADMECAALAAAAQFRNLNFGQFLCPEDALRGDARAGAETANPGARSLASVLLAAACEIDETFAPKRKKNSVSFKYVL